MSISSKPKMTWVYWQSSCHFHFLVDYAIKALPGFQFHWSFVSRRSPLGGNVSSCSWWPSALCFSFTYRRRWTTGSQPFLLPYRARGLRSRPAATARQRLPHALRRCQPPLPRRRPSPARGGERRTRRSVSVCSARRNKTLLFFFFLFLFPGSFLLLLLPFLLPLHNLLLSPGAVWAPPRAVNMSWCHFFQLADSVGTTSSNCFLFFLPDPTPVSWLANQNVTTMSCDASSFLPAAKKKEKTWKNPRHRVVTTASGQIPNSPSPYSPFPLSRTHASR